MSIWKQPISLEALAKTIPHTMVEYLGIEFTEIGDRFLKGRMPVNERTKQPFGIMHGGASCVLAETLGSLAAHYCLEDSSKVCVGLSIQTNHIKMIKDGYVFGKAEPIHIGRSTQVWDILITNEQGKTISVSRLTLGCVPKIS